MLIQPLSKENIEKAINLLNEVFPYEMGGVYAPSHVLRESLEPEKHQDKWRKYNIKSARYWVVVDENTKKIIGTTGLYARTIDPENMVWLGWYCINPPYRGKGYGKKLLQWTINKAREEGYAVMRLYTSTHPNEAAAQKLYEDLKFKIIDEVENPGDPYKTIYRERKLNAEK